MNPLDAIKKSIKSIATSCAKAVLRKLYDDERMQLLGGTLTLSELAHLISLHPADQRIRFLNRVVPMDRLASDAERRECFQLLSKCASVFSVESIRVPSPLGSYEGSLHDKVIMANYCINGTWAPRFQSALLELLPDGSGTFIDIGANIGLTCIPIARARKVDCYAFEPAPENHLMLQRNIEANDVKAFVRPYQLALYSREGSMTFELSEANCGDHRLRDDSAAAPENECFSESGRALIEVKTIRLDDAIDSESLQHPIIIKLDTQGAEVHVLDGAPAVLAKADVIICEVSPYHLARMGHSVEMLLDRLSEYKYAAIVQFDELLHKNSNKTMLSMAGDYETVRKRILELTIDASPDNYFDVIFSRRAYEEILPGKQD